MGNISQEERVTMLRLVDLPIEDSSACRTVAQAYRTYVPALLEALTAAEARIAELDTLVSYETGDHS